MPLNSTFPPNRNNITLSFDSKLSFQLILYTDNHTHKITQVHFIREVYVGKCLRSLSSYLNQATVQYASFPSCTCVYRNVIMKLLSLKQTIIQIIYLIVYLQFSTHCTKSDCIITDFYFQIKSK
jgi:hypothetical protein